ncbi:hypothetical protein C0Q70_15119 [Pomacea canaliculata]|uniref:Uncharacterized protein n=1 Tax=Pomacea canaliculata TaxID=400727 RepID=A0A2T7NTZ7_POMCA|nr:hypothetical protein C0Q70_15119 [Pomacea canaliculata]
MPPSGASGHKGAHVQVGGRRQQPPYPTTSWMREKEREREGLMYDNIRRVGRLPLLGGRETTSGHEGLGARETLVDLLGYPSLVPPIACQCQTT